MQRPAVDDRAAADAGPDRHVEQRVGALAGAPAVLAERGRVDVGLDARPRGVQAEPGAEPRQHRRARPARLRRRAGCGRRSAGGVSSTGPNEAMPSPASAPCARKNAPRRASVASASPVSKRACVDDRGRVGRGRDRAEELRPAALDGAVERHGRQILRALTAGVIGV